MGRFKKATGWLDSLTDHRYFKRGAVVTAVTGAGAITLVKVGIGVVVTVATVFLGLLGHIPAFYLVAVGIWVFGAVLWTMNQFTARRVLRFGAGSIGLGDSSQTAPVTALDTPSPQAHPESVKQLATPAELAQPVIRDRQVRVVDIPRSLDGWIRQKTFVDCDLVGPAIIYPPLCEMVGVMFGLPFFQSVESILWPRNPQTRAVCGIIGMAQCRFQGGQTFNLGFTGDDAFLAAFRAIAAQRPNLQP
jgi:hypothetical protein